jgi:Protein of unknown function (DUF998)
MKGKLMENISEPTPIADRSEMPSSGWGEGLRSPLTFGLVSCSGVGAFLFTATYLLEGITRPGYDAWQQPISALSLGPGGWVQQVNFVVFGVLTLLSAFGWYRLLRPGEASIMFPLFQSLAGLGLIGAGFFSLDPFPGYPPGVVLTASTVHGTIHTICAWVIIISLAGGCFALAAHLGSKVRWHGWALYSRLTGILILVFWGGFVQGAYGTVAWLVPLAGLAERLSAGSHALWSCLLLVTLLFQQRSQRKGRELLNSANMSD